VGLLGGNMSKIGDILKKWINYTAPTREEIKIGKKEYLVTDSSSQFPEQKDNPFSKRLSMEKCINAAEQCPLFMKGAKKKARDSIRAWHKIEHIDKTKKPFAIDLMHIRNFVERNDLRKLWEGLRMASFVTGDGYLLITFENDENTNVDDAPAEEAYPYKVRLIHSKYITEIGYHPTRKEFQKTFTKHFHYEDVENNKDYWIHPDRILHMSNDKLFGEFGNSKVNLLRNIIKSAVNIDISTGEILAWFAHGLLDIYEEGMEGPQRKYWESIVAKHPSAYIHGEAEIKAIKPEAIDPKPFYDYLVLSIAAAFYMPTHILTGIQVGKVTGAEVGTGDYVKDCKDDQELDYTPLLKRLYSMLLKGKGRSFTNYEIVWNAIYIDEMSEADILLKRVQAADLAYNGARGAGGFIEDSEARRIFNEGQIELEVDKKIKKRIPTQLSQPQAPKQTNITKPTDKAKEEMKKYGITYDPQKYNLDQATKLMIEKRKENAKRDRELGEQILKEQENDKHKSKK